LGQVPASPPLPPAAVVLVSEVAFALPAPPPAPVVSAAAVLVPSVPAPPLPAPPLPAPPFPFPFPPAVVALLDVVAVTLAVAVVEPTWLPVLVFAV